MSDRQMWVIEVKGDDGWSPAWECSKMANSQLFLSGGPGWLLGEEAVDRMVWFRRKNRINQRRFGHAIQKFRVVPYGPIKAEKKAKGA